MEREGAIVDASGEEENNGRPQRQRNPPAKLRENEVIHVSTRAMSLPAKKKQPGSAARSAMAHGGEAMEGEAGEGENAMQPTMQEQMREQTGVLRILVEEINRLKNELQTVRAECQAVKEECQAVRGGMPGSQGGVPGSQRGMSSGQEGMSSSQGRAAHDSTANGRRHRRSCPQTG